MTSRFKTWPLHFTLGLPPSTGMREALQWVLFARLGLSFVLLLVVVLQTIFSRESVLSSQVSLSYGLLAVVFGFNLAQSLLLEKMHAAWWLAAIHILFDAFITSVWIYSSGGRESLFALLYLIQILSVSLIFYQKGALFSAIVASGFFAIVMWMVPSTHGLLTWSIYSGIFVTLGLVGGYLSEELLRTTQSLKEKQLKIEKLTELHERILSNMPTGLLTIDSDLRVNFINPAAEHILNVHAQSVVGRKLSDIEPGLLPFFDRIESQEIAGETEGETSLTATGTHAHRSFFVQARMETGRARLQQRVEIGSGKSLKIIRGDVAQLDAEAGLGKLLDQEAAGGRVLLFQDVTKLLHLEERLKQNEKLAAVGQLAAGIAHEIRNPLASMSASIEMLKTSLPPESVHDENQKLMDIAIREIDRLNDLISEFLNFVKPEKIKFERVDIPGVLEEILLAVRKSKDLRPHTKITEEISAGIFASGSAEKIKQVSWNLIRNALQAMNKPGSVRVGCASSTANRVRFWVEDEGCGMTDEVLSHLYEPFFTTKEKGTGLGLATAYKIVEAHHGEIQVTSRPAKGTRFEVFLPQAGAT